MKILLLCWRDSTHPQGGGSERYLERVGEYLAAQGHEVVFRTAKHMNAARRDVREGVTYSRGGGKYGVYPRAWLAILAGRLGLGSLRGVDAVVDTQNGIPFFARLIAGRPTVLLTHHCHREQWPVAGPVIGRLGWFLESQVAPRVYRGAPYVTVSEASREDLHGLGIRGVEIIENGLDPVPDHVPRLDREADVHLLTLSRLVPHKQIEHAMDTVARLPEAVLDVVGTGWWESQLRDSVIDGETGLLADNEPGFHAAVQELICDPARRRALGSAARDLASHYSWQKTGRRFEELLRELQDPRG